MCCPLPHRECAVSWKRAQADAQPCSVRSAVMQKEDDKGKLGAKAGRELTRAELTPVPVCAAP